MFTLFEHSSLNSRIGAPEVDGVVSAPRLKLRSIRWLPLLDVSKSAPTTVQYCRMDSSSAQTTGREPNLVIVDVKRQTKKPILNCSKLSIFSLKLN